MSGLIKNNTNPTEDRENEKLMNAGSERSAEGYFRF